MNIILVNPEKSEINSVRAVGLFYIGAVAEERGHKPKIVSLETIGEDMESYFREESPDIVGVGALTAHIPKTYEICKAAKQAGAVTIVGGAHMSALPEQTLKECKYIDIGIVGEGEETFLELLDKIENNKSYKNVGGIVYRDGRKIRLNERRALISDLDSLPFPARHLTPIDEVSSVPVIVSRGCPFGCRFCSARNVFGCGIRYRSPQRLLMK